MSRPQTKPKISIRNINVSKHTRKKKKNCGNVQQNKQTIILRIINAGSSI